MGGQKGRLNALIEASAQGERAESTLGRSGSLPPFRRSSEAELSAAGIRLKEQNDADKMWIRGIDTETLAGFGLAAMMANDNDLIRSPPIPV
jgi:hypothetical protein